LGAEVLAIDASQSNIEAAKLHLIKDPVLAHSNRLQYLHTTAEELVHKEQSFDVICSLEVIEHVSNIESFIQSCSSLLRTTGKLFLSTFNRTNKSYLYGIIGAEYLLNLVEVGTHDWNKFITPKEIEIFLNKANLKITNITGMSYNPITHKASLTEETSVNYLLCASKCSQ